ncbi:MAG: hypothetical protein J3Q66DRAFT_425726 [Benniella sp.]|nr:MAG: hypothetical protein J3Q66DRAFT_425726 [Benniella sp.]
MSVGAMRFSSQYLSPSASLHLWRLWMRNLFRPFSEAVLRGRSQRPFSEAVLRGFSDRLQADASSADTSIDISKWATFATRWAFCDLLAGLVDSPTRTVELNQVCQQMLHQRLTIGLSAAVALPSSSQASRTTTTEEEAAAVEKIKNITQKDLESFQQQVFSSQALARLLSAPWVLAFSDRTAASPEERKELADLLDRTLLAATSRPQLFNFTVPSCHMIHTNLEVRNPSSSEISVFTGRIHSLVSLIRITPTTAARHTAVVALASLFGVDWSRGPTVTSSGSHGLLSYLASPINPRAMASPLPPVVLGSAFYAVVPPGSKTPNPKSALMLQDLKAGRPAAMTLGHIACHVHRLVQADTGKSDRCHTDPSPSLEVLQLIFLDTLSNHMRSYGQGRVSPAVGSTSGKTKKTNQGLAEDAKELLNDLRSVIPQKSSLRLSWLQRIMDVLVLMSSQDESFERGVILLLKGAVLLWWDEQDIGTHGYREVKGRGRIDDQDQVSVKASSTKDGDMEASLGRKLDMISRDEIGQCDWMIVEKQKKWDPVGHGLASLTFYHCQLATRTIRTNTLRTHFKTLVELRIHPCTPVSSDTVLDVLSACPVLEVLHVRYLSAEVITERGPWTCQHRLRELTAGIQAGQDEEALQPLVFERLAALTRLKMLEILTPIPNSRRSMLGFRLECGLGQLAHWQHLSVLRFSMEWYNINTLRFLQSITTEVVVEVDDQEAAKAHHQDVLGRVSLIMPDIIMSFRGTGSRATIKLPANC